MTAPLATIATTLALVGCGGPPSEGSGRAAVPPPSPAASSTRCRTGGVTITDADRGRSVCVTTGSTVDVVLHGSVDQRWTPVQESGSALRIRVSGRGALPVGVTAAYFSAVETGSATLTSSRPACPSPAPGGVSCLALTGFRVTVTVR